MKSVTLRGKEMFFERNDDFWAGVREINGWEIETFNMLDRLIKPNSVFLDIGAWNGVCSIYASLLGAKCYAIEPDKTALEELGENVRINKSNTTIFGVAISNVTGESCLSNQGVGFGNSMSSLLNYNSKEECLVPTITREEFIKRENIKPDLIKMDTEGGEILIIPSSLNILKSMNCPLALSLHQFMFPDRIKNMTEIADVLFEVYDMKISKDEFINTEERDFLLMPK